MILFLVLYDSPGNFPFPLIAICNPVCENGGVCLTPNKCKCKAGYTGANCHDGKYF